MNGRKQSSCKLFSAIAAVGLALCGAMACAQDNADTSSGRAIGTISGLRQSSWPKPLVGMEHSILVAQPRLGLSSLPGAAQPVVSATLGHEDARYQVGRVGGALSADNPAQSLSEEFTRRGIEVRAGRTHWRLSLAGYGYGSALQRARAAVPESRANRVEYRRGPLLEWYANGPLGLEQGFTLTEAPGRHRNQVKGGLLTIALTLGGDLSASADSAAKGSNAGAEILTLVDPNGQAVLRYTGLTAHDASGRELRAWLGLEGDELLLRVDDFKARYPIVVDPFVQRAKLTSSDGAAGDQFGASVAISRDGSTIAVGADGATIGSNALQGAAYVFVKPSTGWTNATQTAKLTASDGALGTLFAGAVGISGDGSTIVVGTIGATIGSNPGQGAAYVFVKPSTGWTSGAETAKLFASDGMAHDVFGTSVAISGDGSTIGVGAIGAAIGSNPGQGAAYVFLKPSSGWVSETQADKLIASDGAANDSFGDSMAISSDGSVIVSGAPAFSSPGAAYVFVKPSTGWLNETETAKLTASDGVVGYYFGVGSSISDDGSTIIEGVPRATVGSNVHQGAAYVYVMPSTGWVSETETARLTASDGAPSNELGSARISGDGRTIVAGAVRATVGSNLLQGAAYVFLKPLTGWISGTETGKLTASDGAAGDFFGNAVTLSGDGTTIVAAAAAAAIGSNSGQGAAYVFLAAPLASPSPTGLSFANQAVGTTSNGQIVTLTNTGNVPLHVIGVAATNGFSTTSNCVTVSPLAVGASCLESVAFMPSTTGAATGNLTFTDDSNGIASSTQSVALSGDGVKGTTTTVISVVSSPSVVGQPVTVSLLVAPPVGDTLMPSGTVTMSASTGEICVGSAPAGSCALTFLTAVPRTVTASYGGDGNFVGSTSAGVTQTVQDFTLAASTASQTIPSGHKATYNLTLTSVDGFSGPVSLACSGGPANSICAVLPNPVNLNGSANATVTVSGAKMSHGTFTLTFTGTFGSGNPATGGLTRTTSVGLTVK